MKTERECYQVFIEHFGANNDIIEKYFLNSPELCCISRVSNITLLDFALDIGLISPEYHANRIDWLAHIYGTLLEEFTRNGENEND